MQERNFAAVSGPPKSFIVSPTPQTLPKMNWLKLFMYSLHMLCGTLHSALQMGVQVMKLTQCEKANYSSVWWLGLECAWAPSRLETEPSKHLISWWDTHTHSAEDPHGMTIVRDTEKHTLQWIRVCVGMQTHVHVHVNLNVQMHFWGI